MIHFLNALLGAELPAPVTAVEILNPYNEREFLDDKLSIVDVKARDVQGQLYQVESMQGSIAPHQRELEARQRALEEALAREQAAREAALHEIEAERQAKEAERQAKEAALQEKEAALAQIARLETRLRADHPQGEG